MPRIARLLLLLFVGTHLLLLACYTVPDGWVPEKAKALATVYTRGLFHQQWMLFAPDPPLCSCQVQVQRVAREWLTLGDDHGHYLHRRMARGIAWHVQRELAAGDVVLSGPIAQAMRNMAGAAGEGPLQFRLEERCVTDPKHPAQRQLRLTDLRLP